MVTMVHAEAPLGQQPVVAPRETARALPAGDARHGIALRGTALRAHSPRRLALRLALRGHSDVDSREARGGAAAPPRRGVGAPRARGDEGLAQGARPVQPADHAGDERPPGGLPVRADGRVVGQAAQAAALRLGGRRLRAAAAHAAARGGGRAQAVHLLGALPRDRPRVDDDRPPALPVGLPRAQRDAVHVRRPRPGRDHRGARAAAARRHLRPRARLAAAALDAGRGARPRAVRRRAGGRVGVGARRPRDPRVLLLGAHRRREHGEDCGVGGRPNLHGGRRRLPVRAHVRPRRRLVGRAVPDVREAQPLAQARPRRRLPALRRLRLGRPSARDHDRRRAPLPVHAVAPEYDPGVRPRQGRPRAQLRRPPHHRRPPRRTPPLGCAPAPPPPLHTPRPAPRPSAAAPPPLDPHPPRARRRPRVEVVESDGEAQEGRRGRGGA